MTLSCTSAETVAFALTKDECEQAYTGASFNERFSGDTNFCALDVTEHRSSEDTLYWCALLAYAAPLPLVPRGRLLA